MNPASLGINVGFSDLCSGNNQELAIILRYPYRMLKPYLKTPVDHPTYKHRRANLVGEMYENLIYERLLTWASNENRVSEFLLKGPYVNHERKKEDGLVYNSRNQIFYMSADETIAEFDALFTFDGCRYFVEITNTENKFLLDDLEYESLRKFNLLKILFPEEQLGYWIITTYPGQIYFKRLPNVAVSRTPKYDLNPDILRGERKVARFAAPAMSKFKTIQQLKLSSFDYLSVMSIIQSEIQALPQSVSKAKLAELIIPYTGLIERVFLGKLLKSDFMNILQEQGQASLIQNIDVDHAILALKIKAPPQANVVAYVISRYKSVYEIDIANSKIKLIELRKRTTRDIRHFDDGLKQLTLQVAREYILSSGRNIGSRQL